MTEQSTVRKDFLQPFDPGEEAVLSSGENLTRQILSFSIGVLLGMLLGFCIGLVILASTHGVSSSWTLSLSMAGGVILTLVSGTYQVPPARNGVPELFGSYVHWYLAPAGLSWWFPKPLGDLRENVHVGEAVANTSYSNVESADNVQIRGSITIRMRVKYPLVYVRHGRGKDAQGNLSSEASSALAGLLERTFRWYVSSKLSTNLPSSKGEASRILSGIQDSFMSDAVDDRPAHQVRFAVQDESADGRTIREIAADLGFEILEVLVTDFTLPEAITAAAEQERVEDAQRRSEKTEMHTLVEKMDILKNSYPELSDYQVLVGTQAENHKRDVIDVGGDAGDFTKGASVQTSKKRK